MRATERALIKEPVQREQHLVAVLAVGLAQVTRVGSAGRQTLQADRR
jgi:hypothetical protein